MGDPQMPFQSLYRALSNASTDDAHFVKGVLRRSEKFSFLGMPIELLKAGIEFADQLNVFGILGLPFPETAFLIGPMEEDSDVELTALGSVYYMLPVCWQDGDRISGQIFCVGENGQVTGGATLVSPPAGIALKEWSEDADYAKRTDKIAPLWGHDDTLTSMKLFGGWVLAALGCLNSEGLETTTTRAPKFINGVREKKGKPPIFSLHRISIDLSKVRMPGMKGADMTHASPRLHWRRGHIRRLAVGRMTIVRPCLVGEASLGHVAHDYRVRA